MNNFLALGAFVACAWVASNVVLLEPASSTSCLATDVNRRTGVSSEPIADRNVLEARRAPVPLVRTVRPSAVTLNAVNA